MSNITLSSVFATALASHSGTSVIDQLAGGTLIVYSGTAPSGANEALSGNTVLATFTFGTNVQLTQSAGVIALYFSATGNTGTSTNPVVVAAATGTASFFRILNTTPAALIQGLVGTSGADFNLSSTSITTGDNVSITGTPSITVPVT